MNKKTLSLFFLVFALSNCIAQPNAGFENWHNEYSYEVPNGWQTMNIMSMSPPNPLSAFKVTGLDKHSGNYALMIKTVYFTNNFFHSYIGDSAGNVFTGKVIVSPISYKYGFPYTSRPAKLEFWSKYNPVGNDTAGVGVMLTKFNGISTDTVALAALNISTTLAYTLFQIDLTYYSAESPDSASILLLSSKLPSTARLNSKLYVDDFSFTGWVGTEEHSLFSDKVKIFPNPAIDLLNVIARFDDANSMKVTDALGKLMGEYKIQNYGTKINTSNFTGGIYFYEICDHEDRVCTKGKFNIIK